MPAPIVLFVYNRPWHTLQTLAALAANPIASRSLLVVFADGPKAGAGSAERKNIARVRELVQSRNWCGEVRLVESAVNIGCADSIINGVTRVVEEYGSVIVLEDDIVTSPGFLEYMNDALHLFAADQRIGSVNAYAEELPGIEKFPPYFLLDGADCWGWGTWKDRWERLVKDPQELLDTITRQHLEDKFEYGGQISLLNKQIAGTIDCWDILWHGTQILAGQQGVFSNCSFVKNIGLDGSGTHRDYTAGTTGQQPAALNTYSMKIGNVDTDELFKQHASVEKQFRKLRYKKIYAYRTPLHYFKTIVKKLTGADREKWNKVLDLMRRPFHD